MNTGCIGKVTKLPDPRFELGSLPREGNMIGRTTLIGRTAKKRDLVFNGSAAHEQRRRNRTH